MTLCNLLMARTLPDGKTVEAWEKTDKHAAAPYYEIVVSQRQIGLETIRAARTTWKKKFFETVGNC